MRALSLLRLVLCLGLWLIGLDARADEPHPGPYLEIGAGALLLEDQSIRLGGEEVARFDYEPTYQIGGAIGYRFGQTVRFAVDFQYSDVRPDRVRFLGTRGNFRGGIDAFTVTLNGFYDFVNRSRITPYLGAGMGVAIVEPRNLRLEGMRLQGGDEHFTIVSEGGFAVSVTPFLQLVPAYRFQWIDDGDRRVENSIAHILRLALRASF
ncbi:MAG: outer membrane beta-barrel protein [Alphaproteobacteria bacterium]|nr:outer membrane beta-barrel protein [Alphaproteobacteria bacterium]